MRYKRWYFIVFHFVVFFVIFHIFVFVFFVFHLRFSSSFFVLVFFFILSFYFVIYEPSCVPCSNGYFKTLLLFFIFKTAMFFLPKVYPSMECVKIIY